MNKLLCGLCGLVAGTLSLQAAPFFSDSFSYPDGALLGRGGWTITGTSVSNTLQVVGGRVALNVTGQDAYSALSGILTNVNGSAFYVGVTINVATAAVTGDYFLHVTPTLGNTSMLLDRLFVKSSDSGFVLGWLETAGGTNANPVYGSTVLSFNTDYRAIMAYNSVAGTLNDTGALYVNPTDLAVEANNTPYVNKGWTSTSPENPYVMAVNLRQGTAGSAPTLAVDDLVVSQTFSDVAVVVPEPQSLGLLVAGLLSWRLARRRE